MQSNLINPSNPTQNGEIHTFGLSGYATVSFQIDGTISAGNYTPQVSNDGANWFDIAAIQSDGNEKSLIIDVGMYRCDVNGYQLWRLLPSGDLNANCTVISFGSPTAIITKVIGEGDLAQLANNWVGGAYAANAIVRHSDKFWVSKQNSNSEEPGTGTQWLQFNVYADIDTYILGLFNQGP